MFEEHILDFFGPDFDSWMDKNGLTCVVVSWSNLTILPDDHPDYEKSLKEYIEDEETAFNICGSQGNITVTYDSAKIVEVSEGFPEPLLLELKGFAPGFNSN